MEREHSISDALAERGYGHRRNETSVSTGRHTVFKLDTGDVVGNMTAFEAHQELCGADYDS